MRNQIRNQKPNDYILLKLNLLYHQKNNGNKLITQPPKKKPATAMSPAQIKHVFDKFSCKGANM